MKSKSTTRPKASPTEFHQAPNRAARLGRYAQELSSQLHFPPPAAQQALNAKVPSQKSNCLL